jgi:hypothetical protein
VVYSRKVADEVLTFGVSGRLYKSNVLMYDHQTESLWSQLLSKAVAGDKVGTTLTVIPSTRARWKTWRKRHPDAPVMSTDTGYDRNYSQDPYEGYHRLGTIWFPVGKIRKDLSPKERVVGVEMGADAKAYPISILRKRPGVVKDTLGGVPLRIEVNSEGEVTAVKDAKGGAVSHVFVYWFAWQAFHPETLVFEPE